MEKTFDSTNKRKVSRVQVAIVGMFDVGKTCLARNLVEAKFVRELDSTSGIEFCPTSAIISVDESVAENSSVVGPLLRKSKRGNVVASTLANELNPPSEETQTATIDDQFVATNAGHQTAATDNQSVATSAGQVLTTQQPKGVDLSNSPQQLLKDLKSEIEEELADPDQKKIFVDILDCGGQRTFSVAQSMCFNAAQSIFLLVYRSDLAMDKPLREVFRESGKQNPVLSSEMTPAEYIQLWLSTISSLAKAANCTPEVLIVGTYSTNVSADALIGIEERVGELVESCSSNLAVYSPFSIDNSQPDGPHLRELRQKVHKLVQEKVDASTELVPLSFLKAELFIRRLVTSYTDKNRALAADLEQSGLKACMTVSEFTQFASSHQIMKNTDKEVDDLLQYLHENLAVRSFDHDKLPAKDAYIFLNAEWMLSKVTKILECSMKEVDMDLPIHIKRDISVLKNKGILTQRLCNHLWMEPDAIQGSLLRMMERLGLRCNAPKGDRFSIHKAAGALHYVPLCIQREAPTPYTMQPGFIYRLPQLVLGSEEWFSYPQYSQLVMRLSQGHSPWGPEMDFKRFRFQPFAEMDCYIADLHYLFESSGIAVELACDDFNQAAGKGSATTSMATCAQQLVQLLLSHMGELSGSTIQKWSAGVLCPPNQGIVG